MSNIGETIKKLRLEKDLSMEEMVKQLKEYEVNPSKSMISRWENGKAEPTMSYVRILSKYFNVSLDYLLGFNNDNTSNIKEENTTLNIKEKKLLKSFNKLNEVGKDKVISNAQDLTQIDKYTINDQEANEGKEKENKPKKLNLGEELAKLDPIETVAAHNDYLDDPEEMDKIRQDLEEMDKWDW